MRRLRRLLRRDSRVLDAVLAAVVLAAGVVDVLTHDDLEGPESLNLLPVAAFAAAVFWRRRAPLGATVAWLVQIVAGSAFLTPAPELLLPFFGLLLMPYAAGAYADGSRALAALAVCVVGVIAVDAVSDQLTVSDVLFPTGFAVASWMTGRAIRARTLLAAELHEATVRAEEARAAEGLRAAAEERRRIAREMHDVVAHSVSVMVVQAGGARRILDRDPGRAISAAAEIERTGREALVEMRRLLGVLHGGEAQPELAPQPGLGALETLLVRAREAGLPVDLRVDGEPRGLPTGLDLAAYRVIQEALTNALKHAGGARADVTLHWSDRRLEIEIADRGGRPGASANGHPGARSGHGLVGMRERVRLYGGELDAGPRPGGGFRVCARLPLEPEEAAVA